MYMNTVHRELVGSTVVEGPVSCYLSEDQTAVGKSCPGAVGHVVLRAAPTSGSHRVIMTSIINTDSDNFAGSTSIPSATVSSRFKWTVHTQSWQSALRYCYFASRLHFRINSLRCDLCTESWLITFYRKCTLLICYHWKILTIIQNYHFYSVYSLTCFNTMFFKNQMCMQVV